MMSESEGKLYEGKFLRVVKRNDWEFVERTNVAGIVAIIPITDDNKIVLIKQYREPLQKFVIEVPAGLVGDIDDKESSISAAQRELLEETGYHANHFQEIGTFPISPGLTTEQLTYVIATKLEKRNEGGGDETEQIEVFELPVTTAVIELMEMAKKDDTLLDAKLFGAIMFAYTIVGARIQAKAAAKSLAVAASSISSTERF